MSEEDKVRYIELKLNEIKKNVEERDKEIERLKELCDKYEKEHKTTFETWQKDIKENEHLRTALNSKESIIKEVREYIEEKYDYILGDDTFLDHDERLDRKQMKHIIDILKGEK
jgi:hypothetical protein